MSPNTRSSSLPARRRSCSSATVSPKPSATPHRANRLTRGNSSLNSKPQGIKVSPKKEVQEVKEIVTTTTSTKTKAKAVTWFKCRWCDYQTYVRANVARHENVHGKSAKFRCTSCTYAVDTEYALTVHMSRDHIRRDEATTTVVKLEEDPAEVKAEEGHAGYTTDEISLPDGMKSDGSDSTTTELKAGTSSSIVSSNRKRQIRSVGSQGKETGCVFRCPQCHYWARRVQTFHDHYLSHHRSDAAYLCSACGSRAKFRSRSDTHISQAKERGDPKHSGAETLMTELIPEDQYAAYLKLEAVPADVSYGWISSSSSSDEEEDDIPEGPKEDEAEVSGALEPAQKVMRMDLLDGLVPLDQMGLTYLEEEEAQCRARITQLGDAIHTAYQSLNDTQKEATVISGALDKIEAVRNRVAVMKEKVRVAQQEVDSILARKELLRRKTRDAVSAKVRAEITVRTHQCQVLQIRLSILEARDGHAREHELSGIEEMIQAAELEVEQAEAELQALRQEELNLQGELEESEETRHGALQVLTIVQSELETLEAALEKEGSSSGRMDQLRSGAQKLIREYAEQEENLVKIIYLRTLVGIRQKEEDWLVALDKQYGRRPSDGCRMLSILPSR